MLIVQLDVDEVSTLLKRGFHIGDLKEIVSFPRKKEIDMSTLSNNDKDLYGKFFRMNIKENPKIDNMDFIIELYEFKLDPTVEKFKRVKKLYQ